MGEPHRSRVEIPADFADMLAQLVAPGQADAVGEAFEEALKLDDEELTAFLEQLAERIRSSPQALTSAELLSLVRLAAGDDAARRPPA